MNYRKTTLILMLIIFLSGFSPFILDLLYNIFSLPVIIPLSTSTAIFFYILTILTTLLIYNLEKSIFHKFWLKMVLIFIPISFVLIFVVSERGDIIIPGRETIAWFMNSVFVVAFFLVIFAKYFLSKPEKRG